MWPHDLKALRARQHLDELKAEITRWVEGDGYTIRVEPDPKPFETDYEVRAFIQEDIGEDPWSLLIGDFLQNARSALDYIAFALGEAGAGREGMPASVARNAGFPIVGDVDAEGYSGRGSDLFAEAANKQLATVSEPVRTAIERIQPYYRHRQIWDMDPLWRLHELARFDRHRFLHPAVMRAGDIQLDPTSRNVRMKGLEIVTGDRVFEDEPWDEDGTPAGALLASFTAMPANPNKEMHMHVNAWLDLGWDPDTLPDSIWSGLEHETIEITLTAIAVAVTRALETLRPFLPRMYWDY